MNETKKEWKWIRKRKGNEKEWREWKKIKETIMELKGMKETNSEWKKNKGNERKWKEAKKK